MRPILPRFAFTVLGLPWLMLLNSCSGGGSTFSYQNVTVTLSPTITALGVGASQTFSTTTTNAPNYPNFFVLPLGVAGTGAVSANVNTATGIYTAPATPPIYTAAQVASGAVQGQVGIIAYVSNSQTNTLSDASATVTFTITAPSVTAGIAPTTASVAVNATLQFTGYAVGNLNNGVIYQVNGVTGGSTAYGTITANGLYTAPASIPMNGVTVTVISAADPTKTASAVVTVT